MSRKRYDHSHMLYRVPHRKIYRCAVQGCTYVETRGKELLVNQKAQCPYCKKDFIITYVHLRNARIHCMECTLNGKPLKELPDELIEPIENISETITKNEMDVFSSIFEKEKT